MKKYQNIAEAIRGLKKPFLLIALSSALVNLLILGIGIRINLKTKSKAFTTMEACFYGMLNIFDNHPEAKFVNPNVIKDLKGKKFKMDKISLIKVKDKFHCDVIAKDLKGYRSFAVALEKNTKFQHLYRIFDVREQRIVSKYQWKSNFYK